MKKARTELFTMRMSKRERESLDKAAAKFAMKAAQYIRFVVKRELSPEGHEKAGQVQRAVPAVGATSEEPGGDDPGPDAGNGGDSRRYASP